MKTGVLNSSYSATLNQEAPPNGYSLRMIDFLNFTFTTALCQKTNLSWIEVCSVKLPHKILKSVAVPVHLPPWQRGIYQSSACFMGTWAAFIELPLKYPLCPLFWAPCLGSYVGRSYVSRELEKMDATDAISRQRWMWIPDPTTPIFLPLPMHCHKYPLALAVVCTYSSC